MTMNKILLVQLIFIIFNTYCYSSNLRQISNIDNLSNNSIESLYQDKQGRLWIGTCDGLNLYDGRNIEVYRSTGKNKSLSGNNIVGSILGTEENILWLKTSQVLNRLDWTTKTIQYYDNGFSQYTYLRKDKYDRLFTFHRDGVVQYFDDKKDAFRDIELPNIVYKSILNFIIDHDNKLWFIDKSGLIISYQIEYNDREILLKENTSAKHPIPLIYCFYAEDNIFLVDVQHNLYSYNLSNGHRQFHYNLANMIKEKGEITSIIFSNENIYIGYKTSGVQILVKADSSMTYEIETLPINCGIFTLLKDRNQDIVWIGTDGQGIYMHSNDVYTLKSTRIKDYVPQIGNPVRSIHKDYLNTLWIGTKGDGIVRIHDYDVNKDLSENRIDILNVENSGLIDNSVYCTTKSKKNILWIGTESGLNYYSYDSKQLKKVEINDKGKPIIYIHDVYEQDSILWIASVGMGIIKARLKWDENNPNIDNLERIMINNGNSFSNHFFRLFSENEHTMWVANRGNGVFKVDTRNMNYEKISFSDNVSNKTQDDILSILKTDDYMYFGSTAGLIEYKAKGDFKMLDYNFGFMNNTIHEMLQDDKDKSIWLSTNGVLINYNPHEKTFRNYGLKDGLSVVEFSDGASFKDETTGVIYFGGVNGFVSITKNKAHDNTYMPNLTFDGLTIFGKEENIKDYLVEKKSGKELVLNNTQNFITIKVSAIDFLDAYNYTFLYKIESINDQWIDNGNSNIIPLTNLNFGNYKLHVKYINRVVGSTSDEYTLSIKILPPWYFSNIVIVTYVLLFITSLFVFFKYLNFRNEKKRRKIIRILEAQHKEQVYESKLDFFTSIAHEFCTPLTLIYGPCNQIIKQQNGNNNNTIKYTNVILRNAQRLNYLIQDLIDFRKIETENKPPIIEQLDIVGIVSDVIFTFKELAEANKAKFYKIIPQSLQWNSDKNYIITIVTNLLSNAFKYMSQEGCVEIEMKEESDHLSIMISNTGKGIKEEDLDKIFDKHYIWGSLENKDTTKLWSRNGLGLAISSSMVKNLNGSISVSSRLNEWTVFSIKLPKLQTTVNGQNNEIQYTNSISPQIRENLFSDKLIPLNKPINTNKQTILAIDDEIDMLWFISDIFEEEFNVITVSSPLEVNSVLNTIHPDIILCDINMPKLNGIELTFRIKSNKHTAHIPFIIISAKHGTDEQIKGINAGAELYVTKPFNVEYLKSCVNRLMKRKTALKEYFSSSISAYQLDNGVLLHNEDKRLLKEIQSIIDNNIRNKKLNADFIANEMNISLRNLYRKLAGIDQANISQIIKNSRLYIAESLLLQTKKTIDEIIYEAGFNNRASFYNAFSKKHNCTPTEFRDKNREL